MALKAGYVGIKKSMLGVINSLAGAKLIKTIGDGLKLTSAGKLSADINPETMEFKSGKISAKATVVNYDTDEVDTGAKWIDGKTIYRKVLSGTSVPADGSILLSGVDHVVNAYGSQFVSTKNVWYQFPFTLGQSAQIRWELYTSSHDVKLIFAESNITNYSWVFEYTKVSEE